MAAQAHSAEPVDAQPSAESRLADLRRRGAHRHDPVRFAYLEALARRLSTQTDAVRAWLTPRFDEALSAFVARADAADGGLGPRAAVVPATSAPSALSVLLRYLERQAGPSTPGNPEETAVALGTAMALPPRELKAMRHNRRTWARLSVDRQLQRSLAKAPDNPGPLNSQQLILRSLRLMQAVSPDYLGRFMAQVEALVWLEQAGSAALPVPSPARAAARREAEKARKPGRGKPPPAA